MATKAQVQALLELNLATGTDITAVEHRAVETAILNFISQEIADLQTQINNINNTPVSPFLRVATFALGDISGGDSIINITFPSVGTSNYIVLGSLYSNSTSYTKDNDVFISFKNYASSSFDLLLKEVTADTQNLTLHYAIIPLP